MSLMSQHDRIAAVAAALAAAKITFVLDITSEDKHTAWRNATKTHGEMVASVCVPRGRWRDGQLYGGDYLPVQWLDVSFPRDNTRVGRLITNAFQARGFHTVWSGRPTAAIAVRLDPS